LPTQLRQITNGLSSRFFSIFIGAKRLIQTQVLLNFIF